MSFVLLYPYSFIHKSIIILCGIFSTLLFFRHSSKILILLNLQFSNNNLQKHAIPLVNLKSVLINGSFSINLIVSIISNISSSLILFTIFFIFISLFSLSSEVL